MFFKPIKKIKRPRLKKVRAFTINEMMVVLVISTIVVGIALSVLTSVRKQFLMIEREMQQATELNLLQQALWLDFHRYQTIEFHQSGQLLRLKHALDSVDYHFFSDKIIREKDTFHLSFETQLFFDKGNPVQSGNVDALTLRHIENENIAQDVFVFQTPSAFNFMNEP